MPAKNLQPVMTYLPPEIKADLEAVAERKYISLAAQIRIICVEWVECELKSP